MQNYNGKKILLLDGLTSQCLEYTKAFNKLGCDTTVLCENRYDICYASKHPMHKILGSCSDNDLEKTEKCIVELIKTEEYDVAIPFTEYSARILSMHKQELSKCAHLIVNDYEYFDFAQNKNNVMRICMENGIPCPFTIFNVRSVQDVVDSAIKFPVILKPSHGFGSHGFHICNTLDELKACLNENGIRLIDMVIQEYIPKTSLNASDNVFIDSNGNVRSAFTYVSYRYYPIEGGSGVLNATIDRKDIHNSAICLLDLLHLKGAVGVDFIIDSRDDIPKVLEVNLRPNACAKVGFLAGVDQAKQILENLYCDEVQPITSYKTDIRVRRSQIDWVWFLKSPDRFKTKPSWFDRKNTVDQLFSWDDPGPWFAFWIYGLRKFLRERRS